MPTKDFPHCSYVSYHTKKKNPLNEPFLPIKFYSLALFSFFFCFFFASFHPSWGIFILIIIIIPPHSPEPYVHTDNRLLPLQNSRYHSKYEISIAFGFCYDRFKLFMESVHLHGTSTYHTIQGGCLKFKHGAWLLPPPCPP